MPVDRRLLQLVPPVRGLIVRAGLAEALRSAALIARGGLIGIVAARVIAGIPLTELLPLVYAAIAAVLLHAFAAWYATSSAQAASADILDTLRTRTLTILSRRDPREVEEQSARWRTILTDGLADFRPYLTDYLPSLLSLIIATPLALAAVSWADPTSGLLALITLPLIPLFMVLIGKLTAAHTARKLETASVLAGQVADLLRGARTLTLFDATSQPSSHLRRIGAAHASSTLGVLRLAFLSSFALEFLATLSVALVAVSIGLRLVYGELDLESGLVALIIVPEVFAPLRAVGKNFHAAAEGVDAADACLTLHEEEMGAYLACNENSVTVSGLSVKSREGYTPENVTFVARPGEITALTGPNGAGKSTVFLALLGLLPDASVTGTVTAPGLDRIAYLPARPLLTAGTVADNLRLGGAPQPAIDTEAAAVGVDVPMGHRITADGRGLSAGQAQRVALARTLASPGPVYLLDEPSAHLSPEIVDKLKTELRRKADQGATIVIATHDRRIAAIADTTIDLPGKEEQ